MKGLRIILALVLAIAVVAVLFTAVFPMVDRMFVTNPVLGSGDTSPRIGRGGGVV